MLTPFTRIAAAGALFLALFTTGCQTTDSSDKAPAKNGVLSAQSKGQAGTGEFLLTAATCKDKNPAQLGIAFKCTDDTDLVCGCDGKTYINYCNAWGVGQVNVEHKGACGTPVKDPPIVLDPLDPVDTGLVDTNITVDPGHPVCGTPDPDSTIHGHPIDPVLPSRPVLWDAYPICRAPVPQVAVRCTDEKHPVCGCDNVTYLNGCLASTAGVNTAYEGGCKPIK